jgi:hypothetical protein
MPYTVPPKPKRGKADVVLDEGVPERLQRRGAPQEANQPVRLQQSWMCLLILRIGPLRAHLTDVLKDLAKLLLGELKAHHDAFMREVVLEDKLVVIWVILAIGFLYSVLTLLQLLPEFVDQVIGCVHRLRVLEVPARLKPSKSSK